MRRVLTAIAFATVLGSFPAMAQEIGRYTKSAAFDDIRFELGQAVIARGLAVQSEGDVGKMLDRTGADVGSDKPVYKNAQFVTVCSARYTRMLVEADPALAPNCPFVLYIYETVAKPGEVVVGFRRLDAGATAAGRKAVADVEAMLDGIVKDALK